MPLNGEILAICEEFNAELVGLLDFAQIGKSGSDASLSPRARIAAANGATLLLAALYEECIRQLVKSVFNQRKAKAAGIKDFPETLTAAVWKRSFEKISRRPFDEVKASFSSMNTEIRSIMSFCLKGDLDSDVSSVIAHNDNNMRPDEMAKLFKQIGISSVVSKIGACESMKKFFAMENSNKCAEEVRSNIEDFFRRRNEIAHAIQVSSSMGPSEIAKDVDLFKAVTSSLAEILSAEI